MPLPHPHVHPRRLLSALPRPQAVRLALAALTCASCGDGALCLERPEFVGDTVLGHVVTLALFLTEWVGDVLGGQPGVGRHGTMAMSP